MIKNLITTAILSTTIGIQNITTLNNESKYQNTSNTYNSYIYDVNDILDKHIQYKINSYSQTTYGSGFSTRHKGLVKINQEIDIDKYTYEQCIMIQCKNTGNLNITKMLYKIQTNVLNEYALVSPDNPTMEIYYYNSLTTAQLEFINGKNYTSYAEMQNLETNIWENAIQEGAFQRPTDTWLVNSHELNVMIYLKCDYDSYYINNQLSQGEFMFSMEPITKIQEDLYYTPADPSNYEVVDIPGMMFTILGMPFAWISTAFNFTIFPNTPYEINLSAILMAIIVSLIVLYIVKKIIK